MAQRQEVLWPAEMTEVLSAQSGKGLSIKAAFAREADSPGERPVTKMSLLKQPVLGHLCLMA